MKNCFFALVVCCFLSLLTAFRVLAADTTSEKIRIAMASISTSQVNLWVPLETGLFKKHGLDVDLVFISGAPIVNAALLSGEVALAQGGPAPAIQSNLKGAGTYMILGNTNRFPYQLVAASNIKTVPDLKGKEAYVEVVVKATPKIPYPTKAGIQTLMSFMAKASPEIANAKPDDFVDTRFIKELEDSGFYARLYR